MKLNFSFFNKGIAVNNKFKLRYPHKIWKNYPDKNFFLDNLAYANTVCSPLVSGLKKIRYNTSKPFIKKYIDESIIRDMPSAVEDYSGNSDKLFREFKKIRYKFKNNKTKKPVFSAETFERAVVPFSCGKDSLLTLAVCNEAGLNPVSVYFNDSVSPKENKLKINYLKKISRRLGITAEIVKNEIERLNDFEFWEMDESVIGYSHLVFNFCLLSFPINSFYNARYTVLGNEYGLNSKFKNKEGKWCYPSYDQSFEGTKRLNKIFKEVSSSKIEVTSVVSPVPDLLMVKMLHGRYKDFGKYQVSCSCLDATNEKRWCCNCNDDVRFFIYMLANGKDPKSIGIRKNLLDKKYFKHHILFNPESKERYDKVEGDDEELKFAYYLAYRNGAKGYAIDRFKEEFLKEVKENEDKLYKEHLGLHDSSLIPKKIRQKILSIYKEEQL